MELYHSNYVKNDLFFLCSLIDYIARKTKNYRSTVVNALGRKELQHVYDYADVYHCENIDNYNSSMYYESPGYLYASYKAGAVLA